MKKLEIDQVVVKPRTNAAKLVENSSASAPERTAEGRLPSVIVGRIAALPESGLPLVDFPGNTSGKLVLAQTLISITTNDTGREIALTFENGDPSMPIIVGLFQKPSPAPPQREIKLDDDRLVLSAKKEVVIQCGKSSITLTNAGKVLIRGAYLLSRSSGVNRIKGGSVQIN